MAPDNTPRLGQVLGQTLRAAPRRKLGRTPVHIPILGFGASGIGNLYHALDDQTVERTLDALRNGGIDYMDTAPHYGQGLSERRLGAYLGRHHKWRPVISTKVGRVLDPIPTPSPGTVRHGFVDGDPFEPIFDYTFSGVMRAFTGSLERLDVARVDIVFAHDLGAETHGSRHARHFADFTTGGYEALRSLKDQGLTKAIGIGVNEVAICLEILDRIDIDVILLAGRYTLLEQTALQRLLPECLRRNVSVIVGGPFNSGILATGAPSNGTAFYNYEPAPPDVIARVTALDAVCRRHGVPLPAAALQFPLAHPAVAGVLAGMASDQQVGQNLARLDTPIPQSLWTDLAEAGLIPAGAFPFPPSKS